MVPNFFRETHGASPRDSMGHSKETHDPIHADPMGDSHMGSAHGVSKLRHHGTPTEWEIHDELIFFCTTKNIQTANKSMPLNKY
jgi:hypothetical protein